MMRKLNIRLISFLLILAFSQKLGLRLWIHQVLHETQAGKQSSSPGANSFQITCDCMDDALMPLSETGIYHIDPPVTTHTVVNPAFSLSFSSAVKLFCSLKGPPTGNC